jgi:hypothetical protein
MQKLILMSILALGCLAFIFRSKMPLMNKQNQLNNQLVLEWYNVFLNADRYSEGFRGPISARTMGYIGLAGYESALPQIGNSYQSFAATHLNLNMPVYDSQNKFQLLASLNACYKKLFDKFYLTVRSNELQQAEQLFQKWELKLKSLVRDSVYRSSKQFGTNVANIIFEYSATDSVGHQAYLHIYDKRYIPKEGEGMWKVSEEIPMPPLLPHWGEVRPFVIRTSDYLATPLPGYSLLPSSLIYTEALEVLTVSSPLSVENRWIAEFWSDDHPGITFTPSSRWISITNQVIKKECPAIEKTLETYLKLGFALTDGSIACWKSKYFYNLERPETYIHKVFDKNWYPLFHTPPFPSYPSGHSVFGAAACEVLTQMFGPNYQMVDNSHKGRDEFMGKPRMFHSFYDMAFENAFSRIPLGVHFRMDCEEGLRLGFQIGKKVAGIELMKPNYSVH